MKKKSLLNSDFHTKLEQRNTEEITDIIYAVPSWILRWGIATIFLIMLSIIWLSAWIEYPDVVTSSLIISSTNSPKQIFAKKQGKIVNLLAKEGQFVKKNSPLAYMESTANFSDVLTLKKALNEMKLGISKGSKLNFNIGSNSNLGELQQYYQNFYQQQLIFISTQGGEYYTKKRQILTQDLYSINEIKNKMIVQKGIQEKESKNIENEYNAFKTLFTKGTISRSEYNQQENKYLSSKYPLNQTASDLLTNHANYLSKEKEILELDHTVRDERSNFLQSLNNMITETDKWINEYILIAPIDGYLSYSGVIQENQSVSDHAELFIINPSNTDFFGEVKIAQFNMGKVQLGQKAFIRLNSFPSQQYGYLVGKVNYISDVVIKDSIFMLKIKLLKSENPNKHHKIILKNGMSGSVDIVTEESSLLQRFFSTFKHLLYHT